MRKPIMIMAGGTGGHVFPALALANYLRDQGETIVWMGTRSGIEARLVPAANFPIEWLSIEGLRGKGLGVLAMAPFRLLKACLEALQLLRKHRPRAVLGMGGFASGPGGLMAWLIRIPVVIHEQNAVIGLTNKLLSRIARLNYFAFPQAAKGVKRSHVIGNPVRQDILGIEPPETRLQGRDQESMKLLVLGGSLGAKTLNDAIPAGIALLDPALRPVVRHQCGAKHVQDCNTLYQRHQLEADVVDFIDDMQAAYAWADLVICRAGALTIAELAAAGVASILVPYPYAVDDHQFYNAGYLAQADAAIVIRNNRFDAATVAQQLKHFSSQREALRMMAIQARKMALTDATEKLAAGLLAEALQ
ncbi:MAG: undecaprenyldiphospho-muramoylpentapeptide beta-N-acetylglucosaminyltransferase [Gammaproteobacteria bacterium]|nr:undecaprenyldiphospho-muramoylpentapeptide beta-N-acetylglucosaminyltransferase [Gammaproteobacteria bacterium]MBL6999439.1 undecaprenyldiphospho-muramoylpentapeptide beta-N-acetylglucosaminyltransferase [Gammaproteobacteria bacterium]